MKYKFKEGFVIRPSGAKNILCDECGNFDCIVQETECGKKVCLRCVTNITLEEEVS